MPATPVISPTQPEPQDVEVLLAGAYIPPDRMGATWRLLETLVQGDGLGVDPDAADRARAWTTWTSPWPAAASRPPSVCATC